MVIYIYVTYNALSCFEEVTCISLEFEVLIWNKDFILILLSSLDVFLFFSLPLYFAPSKGTDFCWHLNALENCPNFLRTHNFKFDCVKTFLEGEGRKWIFIKHLLCAFFFVSWVFYMSIHFSISNIILILPLRKLRLSNWSMVTLLEIAEPELNPGLLNSKAWALVHIVGRQDFATTGRASEIT